MSIIKRKKQDKFFIMSNHAAQEKLISLSSIGLLAYIKSLPENWTLHKTYLQKKFTRRTVDHAWAELVQKEFIAGFSCYVDRKKRYYYIVNDEPLTQADFDDFTAETLEEIQSVEGFTAKNIQPIKDCNFSVARFVQHTQTPAVSTTAQNVQHIEYSTTSTEHDGQIQINNTTEKEQINNKKEISIVNNSVNNSDDNNLIYRSFIRDSFYEHGNGLFNKSEVEYFADLILSEIVAAPDSPQQYFNSIVETIAHRRKIKLGITKTETPFYNWLEA